MSTYDGGSLRGIAARHERDAVARLHRAASLWCALGDETRAAICDVAAEAVAELLRTERDAAGLPVGGGRA